MALRVLLQACLLLVMCVMETTQRELSQDNAYTVSLTVPFNTEAICQLHDVIEAKLSRATRYDMNLHLQAHDVIDTSSRHVYVMKQGQLEADHFDQETIAHKSYLDEVHGAALVARCVPHPIHMAVVKLEGSVHDLGRQYRLFPALTWTESLEVSDGHMTADYVMEAITPAWSRPHTQLQTKLLQDEGHLRLTHHFESKAARVRRQSTASDGYYIDILPVVDYKLYQRWEDRIKSDESEVRSAILSYLQQLFTSVALRLNSLQLDDQKNLILKMATPYIATTPANSPVSQSLEETDTSGAVSVHAVHVLTGFENWMTSQSNTLPENDHAMLLTGYDIYGTNDTGIHFNITSGLAFVGTICQGPKSISLVEDRAAYQSEGVATHELGHSLGAVHDGQENGCNSADRYVMTDSFDYPHSRSTLLNPWKFSSCSTKDISAHISQVASNSALAACLTQESGSLPSISKLLSGNDVCQDFFGPQSFACRGFGTPSIDKVCDALYCRKPGTDKCVMMVAPYGTCCGKRKACRLGQCETVTNNFSDCDHIDETCPYGDQPNVVIEGRTCSNIESCWCYRDDVASKCCDTCRQRRTSDQSCLYGDHCRTCQEDDCLTTLENGISYASQCCQTCKNVTCTDSKNLVMDGVTYPTCEDFFQRNHRSFCYFNSHSTACCRTCERLRNKTRDDCQFGDRASNCAESLINTLQCSQQQEANCCETCAEIRSRTTQPPPTPRATGTACKGGDPCSGVSLHAALSLLIFCLFFALF